MTRFRIQSLLELTAFVSLLVMLVKSGAPLLTVLIVHLGAFFGPIVIALWAILFAKQQGTHLDIKNMGVAGWLLRLALYNALAVGAFWIFLISAWVCVAGARAAGWY